MHHYQYADPKRRKRGRRFALGLMLFWGFFSILFFLTFKLPIIPNEWIVSNLGKISCAALSSLLFFYLFFCRGNRGEIVMVESLKYHCKDLNQRIVVCLGIIMFCGIFYLIGRLSVPIITAPSVLFNEKNETHEAKLINSIKGQGWYRGYTKLEFVFQHNHREISFYWPTVDVNQFAQNDIFSISSNEIWLGTHIKDIE